MSLKEVIKKIFSIFFQPSEFNNSGEYKLSFLSNNKLFELKQIINNKYNLIIDPSKLNKEQEDKLIEFYPEIRENNGLVLEQEKYKIFKEHKEECINTPILKFFKGKIKEEDYQALRIAVYIKKKFSEDGEDVRPYLEDLYKKYGKRGNNINNLYGEGYFESFIKLYYKSLEEDNRVDDFSKFFDSFVMEQPITYFVSQAKSEEKMTEELINKINKNKKYGVIRLNIHGIGKSNSEKINNFAEMIKDRTDIKIVSRIEEGSRSFLRLELITF